LADVLGITSIHLNRILRNLREKELLTFRGSKVVFLNLSMLTQVAGFDSTYLRGNLEAFAQAYAGQHTGPV
jgi:hypothetical protein